VSDLDSMIELLIRLDVVLWNVFFFIPANREEFGALLSPQEHEDTFAKLYAASKRVHFPIKAIEAPHYRRYLLQRRARESRGRLSETEAFAAAPRGGNESSSGVFINHNGEVYPSRFLPLAAGNVTRHSLAQVYGESFLFKSLRDPSRLKGKCGRCPARGFCGGSRARAYAITGELFAPDPGCAFDP